MKHIYLSHYDEFHCLAGQCPDTCCAGWQIDIDEEALEKYKDYQGPDQEYLNQMVDWNQSVFHQLQDGRCAFLKEDKLCRMYCNMGEEYLCQTCSTYPRHIEEFYNVREYSLSISCPAVARQLLMQQQPMEWITREDDVEEEPYEEFHQLLYDKLVSCRDYMKQVIQNRNIPFNVRCRQILLMVEEMQEFLDEGCWDTCDRNLAMWAEAFGQDTAGRMPSLDSQEVFPVLYELEPLSQQWRDWLHTAEHTLYDLGEEEYEKHSQEFASAVEHLDICGEQLVLYFLYTYFCGAVYHEYVYAQAQQAVASALLIRELWMAKWLQQDKKISLEDMTYITYHYSRELENSDENLVTMEEWMDEHHFL